MNETPKYSIGSPLPKHACQGNTKEGKNTTIKWTKEEGELDRLLQKLLKVGQQFLANLASPLPACSPVQLLTELREQLRPVLNRPGTRQAQLASRLLFLTASLGLEDAEISGSWHNYLTYLDPVLVAINHLVIACGAGKAVPPSEEVLFTALDFTSLAREALRARRRNVNNNPADMVARLNFLNRLDQLERGLLAGKDWLMMTLVRYHHGTREELMLLGLTGHPAFSRPGTGQRVIRSSPVDTSSGSSSSAASGEWEADQARVGQPEREGREAGKQR